jgi:alkylated DNA repair dioxygenase AlkB
MSLTYQASLLDDLFAEPELRPLGSMVERIELDHGAWIDLRPGWMSNSDALFERLAVTVRWREEERQMYDRIVAVPRLVSWFGQGSQLPDPALIEAQASLNDHYGRPSGQVFSTAGLCFYRTGDDSVAWHGDRGGPAAHRNTMVAILSVGAARTLSIRPVGGGNTLKFPLGHGDLIVMGGTCQRTYEHAILKTKQAVGPRISIQFRPAGVF